MNDQYKGTTQWEQKSKLCKVYAQKDKNGQTYFVGELNKTVAVMVQKVKPEWAKKEGEWQIFIAPIKYEKVEAAPVQKTEEEPF